MKKVNLIVVYSSAFVDSVIYFLILQISFFY